MIGSRTPFRISFIGGGSDLKEFYKHSMGCVISTTIDKYMYIFVHPYFNKGIQIKYSKTELVQNKNEIQHPIAREIIKNSNIDSIDINSIADIPSGTGLGSSSSYTVGLLNALYAYKEKNISIESLAEEACNIEINKLKEPIGKQDQYAAAFGGLNKICFHPNGKVDVIPIVIEPDALKYLKENLILFYLGTTRKASNILLEQKQNVLNDKEKFNTLLQMRDLAIEMGKYLKKSNIDGFGELLNENWNLKKTLSNKISNQSIDEVYNLGIKNGALGGKVLGAGGGGFLLFYCNIKSQNKLRYALKNFKQLIFNFDNTGSRIIYNEKNNKEKIWK